MSEPASGLVPVRQGQFVVTRSQYGISVTRADVVTDRQIKTRTHGKRHAITRRDCVVAAFDRQEDAHKLEDRLAEIRRVRREAENAADQAYREAVAPYAAAKAENVRLANERSAAEMKAAITEATRAAAAARPVEAS